MKDDMRVITVRIDDVDVEVDLNKMSSFLFRRRWKFSGFCETSKGNYDLFTHYEYPACVKIPDIEEGTEEYQQRLMLGSINSLSEVCGLSTDQIVEEINKTTTVLMDCS